MNTIQTRRILSSRPLKGDYASKREREREAIRRRNRDRLQSVAWSVVLIVASAALWLSDYLARTFAAVIASI